MAPTTIAILLAMTGFAVDGDTVDVCDSIDRNVCERVRISNIDAPEVFRPDCPAERALGERATRAAQELLDAGEPRIMQRERYRSYGRTVARIEVNGADIGEALIDAGHAVPFIRGAPPNFCD